VIRELPDDLRRAWDGKDPEARLGATAVLTTVDAEGWPHVALLSAGEIAATSVETVHLALWPSSRTTANLEVRGQGLLGVVADGSFWKIRLRCRRLPDLVVGTASFACIRGVVEGVTRDRVSYATLDAPMRFIPENAPATLERWRRTLDALRAAAGPPG
jgi:hypothetical protein